MSISNNTALTTRAEAVERERDNWKVAFSESYKVRAELERQIAAMRSALNDAEYIMGDEFGAEWRESFPAFAETLSALQPAPEPS